MESKVVVELCHTEIINMLIEKAKEALPKNSDAGMSSTCEILANSGIEGGTLGAMNVRAVVTFKGKVK